jgi:hypothetical protein
VAGNRGEKIFFAPTESSIPDTPAPPIVVHSSYPGYHRPRPSSSSWHRQGYDTAVLLYVLMLSRIL